MNIIYVPTVCVSRNKRLALLSGLVSVIGLGLAQWRHWSDYASMLQGYA